MSDAFAFQARETVPHGTRNKYTSHGCRCEDCRAAVTAYERARRVGQTLLAARPRSAAARVADLLGDRLGREVDADLAREIGVSKQTIMRARRLLGREPLPSIATRSAPARSEVLESLDLLGNLPDASIAREIGVSSTTVHDTRQNLGIPRPFRTAEPVAIQHGTRSGFNYHGCRCEDCLVANRIYFKDYHRRRRAQRAVPA